jgi:hypothetical protein
VGRSFAGRQGSLGRDDDSDDCGLQLLGSAKRTLQTGGGPTYGWAGECSSAGKQDDDDDNGAVAVAVAVGVDEQYDPWGDAVIRNLWSLSAPLTRPPPRSGAAKRCSCVVIWGVMVGTVIMGFYVIVLSVTAALLHSNIDYYTGCPNDK